jgi:hypothetical protein
MIRKQIVTGTKETWEGNPCRNVQGHIDQGRNVMSAE